MKVAIVTMFNKLQTIYSLVNIVISQIEMLLDGGYEVRLIVSEGCEGRQNYEILSDSRVEWIEINEVYEGDKIERKDYYSSDIVWNDISEKKVEYLSEQFGEALRGINICLLHDILFQSNHYMHNRAIRKLIDRSKEDRTRDIHFISFTHSHPFDRPRYIDSRNECRYTHMPNTLYAYPTRGGLTALAKQYNVPEGYCEVVYHVSVNINDMHKEVIDIHKKVDILSPDVLIIYPARLSTGKGLEQVVKLAGAISVMGELDVKVIYCDFKCKDTEGESYKADIITTGMNYGLDKSDIVFTSSLGYENGLSHRSVLDLFELSNLYICPSKSESFGLTVLEAAKKGNFIVLNENVPALKEIGGILGSYFMQWDARVMGHEIQQHYIKGEPIYYGFHARQIIDSIKRDKLYIAKTKSRQRFNSDWIWKNQFKPLLERIMKTYN